VPTPTTTTITHPTDWAWSPVPIIAVIVPSPTTVDGGGTLEFIFPDEPTKNISGPILADGTSNTGVELTPGEHRVFALFNGNADFEGSRSDIITIKVGEGTSITLSGNPNPVLSPQQPRITAELGPAAADDGGTLKIRDVTTDTLLGTLAVGPGQRKLQVQPSLGVGDHLIRATYTGHEMWQPSSREMTQRVEMDATASIGPTTFFPVVDDYRDELIIEGERNVAASVDIAIRATSDGSLVREDSTALATGAYRWTWDGHGTNGATAPAALLPAGKYDVIVILTDAASDTKTVEKRVTLSLDFVEWEKRQVVKRKGRDYSRFGLDKNARISPAASQYRGGVRLLSRRGFAGVVYTFPVRKQPGKVLDVIEFKVVGRSTNRHKAVIAVWNKKLGHFRFFSNYDAAKLIGPRFKTWKTFASPGGDHEKNGKARTTVMTWKGLGRSGKSVFDIKKVILTYRVGTIHSPAGTAASRRSFADAIRKSQPRTRRSVADIAGGRDLPKAVKREDPPALDGDDPSDESTPPETVVESAQPDEDTEVQIPPGSTGTDADATPTTSPDVAETPSPESEPVDEDDETTTEAPSTAG
jgi:hypothetical protein